MNWDKRPGLQIMIWKHDDMDATKQVFKLKKVLEKNIDLPYRLDNILRENRFN
ncbi:hypothetical protein GCM10008924_15140 [Gracilibacillus halotolerans]